MMKFFSQRYYVLIRMTVVVCLFGLTGCGGYVWVPPQPNDPEYAPTVAQSPSIVPNLSGSLYQSDYALDSLYTDLRAYKVGDLLTVKLTESTAANKKAKTKTDKKTGVDIANPTIYGYQPLKGGVELDSKNSFEGDGSSDQQNSLKGDISVTVAEVLPNGNLIIRGEKWITLNQGSEFIRLSGIVRTYDIDANNTVDSTKVANPRITYSGTGALAESNQEGWLARFFNGPLSPY